jgi:hypothetical protein
MSRQHELKPLAIAVGAALAASFGASASADTSPFAMTSLASGYMAADIGEGTCGGDKGEEGTCGGDKDAEGTCGGEKGEEGHCGGDKDAEGHCGGEKGEEGKCGEGKCGGDKGEEGQCGGSV